MMSPPRLLAPAPTGPQCHPTGVCAHGHMAGSVALSHLLRVPQIRRSMIDGNDGQRFIKTLIKSLDEVTLQGKGVTAKTTTVLSAQPQRWGVRGCVRHRARSRGPLSLRQQGPGTAEA